MVGIGDRPRFAMRNLYAFGHCEPSYETPAHYAGMLNNRGLSPYFPGGMPARLLGEKILAAKEDGIYTYDSG